jgi:hypothetical protein
MPFTPQDLTPSEKTLLATITAQTIARRSAQTAEELAAARSEAEQTAGEMIWAQRGELMPAETERPASEWWTVDYYKDLAAGAAANRAMFEDDEEEQTPASRPGSDSSD